MNTQASAPGKLVLCGEYAVLEGAPAIVLALDRRARVALAPAPAGAIVIDAPDVDVHGAVLEFDGTGHLCLADGAPASGTRLAVVAAVVEDVAARAKLPGFRATVDTRAFFADGPDHPKLGLGSSAAVAVALAGALHARCGLPAPDTDRLIAAHRRMQGGRGSGLDIAASLTGGVITYRQADGRARIGRASWPNGLGFACAWSRRPASTGVFLRRFAAWHERAPAQYDAQVRELGVVATAAAAALHAADVAALLDALSAYGDALARLGHASGLDIVSAEHQALAKIAADCGVVYKPCGAGGGDIGLALAVDSDRLDAFRRNVARAGFAALPVAVDPQGLCVGQERSGRGT